MGLEITILGLFLHKSGAILSQFRVEISQFRGGCDYKYLINISFICGNVEKKRLLIYDVLTSLRDRSLSKILLKRAFFYKDHNSNSGGSEIKASKEVPSDRAAVHQLVNSLFFVKPWSRHHVQIAP